MDALDCLLAYNYKIIKDPGPVVGGVHPAFRLCSAKAFFHSAEDKKAVAGWLHEIEENRDYYSDRIIDLGKKML